MPADLRSGVVNDHRPELVQLSSRSCNDDVRSIRGSGELAGEMAEKNLQVSGKKMFMRGRDDSAPPKVANGLCQRSNDLPKRSLMSEGDDRLLQ